MWRSNKEERDAARDGTHNTKCTFRHGGIAKSGNIIRMPIGAGYSVDLLIHNEMQYYKAHSDEWMFFRDDEGVMTGVWIGDLDFTTYGAPPAQPVTRSDAVVGSMVPYFYHNIFSAFVGSSKLFRDMGAENGSIVQKEKLNFSSKDPPHDNDVTKSIAYGCFHMNVEREGNFALIDPKKTYYAAFQVGTNSNTAIFQHFQCCFEYDDDALHMYARYDHDAKRDEVFPNGFVYFRDRCVVSPYIMQPKHKPMLAILNQMLKKVSQYYKTNHHAFETYREGKLVSPQEELMVRAIQKRAKENTSLEESDHKAMRDLFVMFMYRWCSELLLCWSMVFALEDGIEDTGLAIQPMADFMLDYRKTLRYGPKAMLSLEAFDKLAAPKERLESCEFNCYRFDNHHASEEGVFKVDANGNATVYNTANATHGQEYQLLDNRSKDEYVFVLGNESRVTKFVSDTDILQQILIDGKHVDFCLLSKHTRCPDSWFIEKESKLSPCACPEWLQQIIDEKEGSGLSPDRLLGAVDGDDDAADHMSVHNQIMEIL